MIDIHSHVLWGLDDGPATRDESLALMEAAAASGTVEMVATPHANPDYPFDAELARARLEQLQSRASSPKLHLGCDFHLTRDNIEDALRRPAYYAIAGGRYLLVEFSDLVIFKTSERDLDRLRAAGLVPIITHPERNPLLRVRVPLLARWVEQGCLLQVTAGSYLGRFGAKAKLAVEQLTGAGLVHFVASDAHHVRHRPPGLQAAFAQVSKKYGSAAAERLFRANPAAAIAGADVPGGQAASEGPRKGWFSWFTR